MVPYLLILLLLFIQYFGYKVLNKYNYKKWKYLLLGFVLILYMYILPKIYITYNATNEVRCGMGDLGITLAFWIFGTGSAILLHIIYTTTTYSGKK